jgi:hypothetical protein
MAIEEFYFKELQKILMEIRDEMREMRAAMQALLEVPQPIMVNIEPPENSSSLIQLKASLEEDVRRKQRRRNV